MDESRQCKATNRSGVRCGKPAILGGTVCRLHGGAAPQVAAKARERIAELQDKATDMLDKLLTCGHPPTILGAVKTVFDYSGLKPSDAIELSGPDGGPVENVMTVEFVRSDDDARTD